MHSLVSLIFDLNFSLVIQSSPVCSAKASRQGRATVSVSASRNLSRASARQQMRLRVRDSLLALYEATLRGLETHDPTPSRRNRSSRSSRTRLKLPQASQRCLSSTKHRPRARLASSIPRNIRHPLIVLRAAPTQAALPFLAWAAGSVGLMFLAPSVVDGP